MVRKLPKSCSGARELSAVIVAFLGWCWGSERLSLLSNKVDGISLDLTAHHASHHHDVCPRLLAALAVIFDCCGACLALDEDGITELAASPLDSWPLSDEHLMPNFSYVCNESPCYVVLDRNC